MDTEIQGSSREERGLEGLEQESDTGEASCNFYFFPLFCVPMREHFGTFQREIWSLCSCTGGFKVRSNGQTCNKRPKSLNWIKSKVYFLF